MPERVRAFFLIAILRKEPTIKKSIGKAKKDEKNNEEVEARQKGYREVAEKAYEKNQTGRS